MRKRGFWMEESRTRHKTRQTGKHGLMLRGKLLLFVGALAAAMLLVETIFSYVSLSKAYDEAVAVARSGFDSVIRAETDSTLSALQDNYEKYQEHQLTEAEALENAKRVIRTTRYNGDDGYFEADLADGTCVAHRSTKFEGQQRLNLRDPQGNYYIRNIIAAGNRSGGGYTEYYFEKPGQTGLVLKRAYTKKFAPYGWYVTTGVYEDDVGRLVQTYADAKNTALTWLIVCSLAVAVSAGAVAVWFAGSISANLRKVTERLRLLAAGDLHTPVPDIRSDDETGILARAAARTIRDLHGAMEDLTGHLARISSGDLSGSVTRSYAGDLVPIRSSIAHILESMNRIFARFRQSAGQVSVSADHVSDAAQALAQGATEQAGSLEELSQTIAEISGQVGSNAAKAAEARQLAARAGSAVEDGNRQMARMVETMDAINGASTEISKIIKVIDGIAFQTNILALNAAVEAARAGDAGKGFSVVADEVRSLAAKSAAAAKSTAALIEASVAKAAEGKRDADSTARSLREIAASVQNVSSLIHEIDVASSKQARAVSQVTEGIDQISSVVQNNSATAEESAALSEELSSQAGVLQNEIGRFRLAEKTD